MQKNLTFKPSIHIGDNESCNLIKQEHILINHFESLYDA